MSIKNQLVTVVTVICVSMLVFAAPSVGEESNTLDRSMSVLADFYESTADEKISTVTSMITPVSTILMAAVAGFIALSVIMPMYSITGSF